MHLGDRTHHPREDFQRQEGQETVDSWSEKGKNPYVEFCRQERPKVKQPLRHFPTSVTPSSLNLDKMFPSKESQSIPSSSNNNGLSHPKRRQKSSEGDWFVDSQGIDPEAELSHDKDTNSLLLSAITSPTTREQMPPALHQGPVILHRRALPLAALTHLTHRVTQREETRWEILPTSWLLRNTPL